MVLEMYDMMRYETDIDRHSRLSALRHTSVSTFLKV